MGQTERTNHSKEPLYPYTLQGHHKELNVQMSKQIVQAVQGHHYHEAVSANYTVQLAYDSRLGSSADCWFTLSGLETYVPLSLLSAYWC